MNESNIDIKEKWNLLYNLIFNESKVNAINKQNQLIKKGSPVPYSMIQHMNLKVNPILRKYNINIENRYGDKFVKSELIRFKYELNKTLNADDVINFTNDLAKSIKELFHISILSFYEFDNKGIIIIWI